MLQNSRLPSGFLITSALFVVVALLFGCASTKEQEEMLHQNVMLQEENSILQQQKSQLATSLAERDAVTFKLQMELVEKQAEINKIKSTREHLSQAAEQNKVRRPTPGSKVEAVTYLAEVATDIDTARASATAGDLRVFAQADRLIAESKTELERGDFDKVHSLASQAWQLIRDIRIKTALNQWVIKSTYSDFIAPLQLQLVKRSNIRTRPGMHGKVLVTLAAETTVTATGYQGNWIKVTLNDGQIGWIYYSLLAVPETNLPFPKPDKRDSL
jgi:hypothetical protein